MSAITLRAEELEADPRHAALENLAGLLRGQGYDAAVDALHLTVTDPGTSRSVDLWAQRRPDDDHRLWFCWPGEVWICEAALPQDAVVAVKQAMRTIPIREPAPLAVAGGEVKAWAGVVRKP